MHQNATPLRKSAPRPHAKCIFADPLQMSQACKRYRNCYKIPPVCSLLKRCRTPCACQLPHETTSERPKVLRTRQYLTLLTSKCASRHNGVFIISTSRIGPNMWCVCVCTYWLRNVLRATTECTFSTSQLPKVLRCWGVLYMLTSKCASCHNGMQFFTPHLPRWLRTRRFNKPTFRPSGATNHWKNIVFRDFSTFLRTCVFFLLTLSLLWSSYFSFLLWFFPPLLFISPYCRKMSEAWLLNFLR